MASSRFKKAIAVQLARMTALDSNFILRAIDRPRVKGHGTFAIPLPRLLSPSSSSSTATTLSSAELKASLAEQRATLLAKVQTQFDTSTTGGLIRSVQPAGQFLNFQVDEPTYIRQVIEDVVQAEYGRPRGDLAKSATTTTMTKDRYGLDSTIGQGQIIAMDYSSPNIAKPFHGGHLRGTILGNFVTRLLRGFGHQVIGINYLGDWGKQYGLLAVGFNMYGDRTELQKNPIKHLYDVYVKVNQAAAENPQIDKQANEYFCAMESGDEKALGMWREFRELSIEIYKKMYKRLGIEFDIYSGESEAALWVPQAMDQLREKNLIQTLSKDNDGKRTAADAEEGEHETGSGSGSGALYVDLAPYDLGMATLQRADGTTLYLTRDIAACLDRQHRFRFDRHLYVIGDDQSLHLKRLFKIMELLYTDAADDKGSDQQQQSMANHWSRQLQHLSFGKVQGMSTRKGKAVFLEDILDTAQRTMLDKMLENEAKKKEKKTHSAQESSSADALLAEDNTDQEEQDQAHKEWIADQLGISAVVIQDFQAKSSKGYQFSWNRMTDATGNTGIYLQYAHARLCSIEARSGQAVNPKADTSLLTEPEAFDLANWISQYPEVTRQALDTLEPSLMVQYLFGLGHAISAANKVLLVKDQPTELAQARLLLLWSARVTLGNGLELLGLVPMEKM
ncbi:Arginyl-tRNA synthetase [Actinomortierella ambigua]|nr:Arginyl-tRNA synthetase [Actinomortierella ambigua]